MTSITVEKFNNKHSVSLENPRLESKKYIKDNNFIVKN